VTRLINGGLNGLNERRALTSKAKEALARIEGLLITGAQPEAKHATLHRGAKGGEVVALQRILRAQGFALAVDGDFGAATELAVTSFQSKNGLDPDGVVGAMTWAALEKA
jgi:putative chitinase